MTKITGEQLLAQSTERLSNASRPSFGSLSNPIRRLAIIDAMMTAWVEYHSNSSLHNDNDGLPHLKIALLNEVAHYGIDFNIDRATAEVCLIREKEGLGTAINTHWLMSEQQINLWIDIFKAITVAPKMLPYVEIGFTDVASIMRYVEAEVDPNLAVHLNRI